MIPSRSLLSKQGNARLRFEGFATALYIWVDGIFVGYCEDGFWRRV